MTATDELAWLQSQRLHAHRLLPPRPLRDARAASAFVRDRGIVMASGRSSLTVLTEAIAGREIRGSSTRRKGITRQWCGRGARKV